jgi:hypothetical protein
LKAIGVYSLYVITKLAFRILNIRAMSAPKDLPKSLLLRKSHEKIGPTVNPETGFLLKDNELLSILAKVFVNE